MVFVDACAALRLSFSVACFFFLHAKLKPFVQKYTGDVGGMCPYAGVRLSSSKYTFRNAQSNESGGIPIYSAPSTFPSSEHTRPRNGTLTFEERKLDGVEGTFRINLILIVSGSSHPGTHIRCL